MRAISNTAVGLFVMRDSQGSQGVCGENGLCCRCDGYEWRKAIVVQVQDELLTSHRDSAHMTVTHVNYIKYIIK